MNFKLIFCWVYLMLSGGFAIAQSIPSSTYTALFICDTDISSMASNCSDVSQQHFLQAGQMVLGDNSNPECDMNPHDPSCGMNTSSGYTDAKFLVVYARSGTADYWRVTKNIAGVSIQALSTSGRVATIAQKFQQLNETYLLMQDKYSFTQQEDGRFINKLGEYMEELAPLSASGYSPLAQSKLVSAKDVAASNFCTTALEYEFGSCDGELNRWIDGIDGQTNQPLGHEAQLFEGVDVNLGYLTLKLKDDRAFDMPFRFKDGSILVLNIKPDRDTRGIPAIKIDKEKSYTSQGKSFAKYLADRTKPNGLRMSGEEAAAYLSGAGCTSVTTVIGYDKEYLVTTVTYLDGTSKITSVELIGSHAKLETSYQCSGINGLP